MSALVPVTQADHDAVQAYHRAMFDKLMTAAKDKKAGARMGEDEGDAGTLVQAFARHRLSALAEAQERIAALEEALGVFAQLPDDPDMPADLTDEEAREWFNSYSLPAYWLRRARRVLSTKEDGR